MLFAPPLQEGVLGSTGGGWKVSLSSGMILTIAASTGDGAVVQGDTITAQGLYYVPPHSAAITETVTAAHATLPRIDQVLLEVLDANHDGGGSNLARIRILAGTATAGATLDNRTGATALPSSAIRLADVLVPAAAASILAANIRDRRQFARGAYNRILRNSANYTTASGTLAEVDATNVKPRIECSGVPVRVKANYATSHSVNAATSQVALALDGALADSMQQTGWNQLDHPTAGNPLFRNLGWEFVPTTGSHQFSMQFAIVTAGTLTLGASATLPLVFVVEEIVRQNASNT